MFNTSDVVLQAATAALDDERHLQATRQFLAREREFLCAGPKDLSVDFVPTQANFVLLINLPLEVKRLDRELLRRGIIVRPIGGFGLPDAVRVTIGKHQENEALLLALQAILRKGGDARAGQFGCEIGRIVTADAQSASHKKDRIRKDSVFSFFIGWGRVIPEGYCRVVRGGAAPVPLHKCTRKRVPV